MKIILLFAAILPFNLQSAVAQDYTWSKNIACIIYENCSSCHYDDGIAPFSLINYEDAANRALLIAEAVEERYMPPWPPDPDFNDFLDARLLTEEEREAVISWAENGAPLGEIALAPTPPVYESNEIIKQPDLVTQLPEYTSQATSKDDFRCFVIPSGIYEDRFIKAIEVVPGNQKIVHHAGIFLDETGIPQQLDDIDPLPGYECFGGIGADFRFLGGWVPGMPPTIFPDGMGMSLPANSYIVVQLHYPVGSAGESDQTKVNFSLSEETDLREIQISSFLNHIQGISEPLFIPANTVKSFQTEFFLPIDITVLGVGPHMHLVGKSINAYAIRHPTLDTISLVNVPDWDFDWQGFYEYKEPIVLRARSTLHAGATFDNTTNNSDNPSSPPRDVKDGQAVTDEMLIVSLLWTRYAPGDEELVYFDNPPPGSYFCDQITASGEESDLETAYITLFPNPVERMSPITVRFSDRVIKKENMHFEISDLTGRKISNKTFTNFNNQQLNLPESLERGVYFISIYDGKRKRIYSEKIIVY